MGGEIPGAEQGSRPICPRRWRTRSAAQDLLGKLTMSRLAPISRTVSLKCGAAATKLLHRLSAVKFHLCARAGGGLAFAWLGTFRPPWGFWVSVDIDHFEPSVRDGQSSAAFRGAALRFSPPASIADRTARPARKRNPAASMSKRLIDIVVASGLLVVLLPVLLLIALMIRLETPGAALFRQQRGGLGGRVFTIYKFRTMRVVQDDHTVSHCVREDPRVTALGALLRRTSIDELPQLLNVLKGDMSLVGPRPHALAHDQYYSERLPDYDARMNAKPGLTGLAQISGLRGEIQELDAMARRVACDIAYIEDWSPLLDIKLLALTITRAPFDHRAY